MPVFIAQVVQRSQDGAKSVRVASRWPCEAEALEGAKDFVDATPAFSGWDAADSYEIVTPEGKLLAKRPYGAGDAKWTDA